MTAHRTPLAAPLVALLAITGCGQKPAQPKSDPEPPTAKPEQPPAVAPSGRPPKPATPPEPELVPVTADDRKRVEAAEKAGAEVYDAQNGGYEVRIGPSSDAGAVLAALKGTKCVVGLSAEGRLLTDAAFAHVGGFEYLERLTLHQCPNVGGSGFESLAKLPRLKSLAVSECPVTDDACKHFGRVKCLEEVRLIRTKCTDAGLRELADLPALESLSLEGTPVIGTAFSTKGWAKLRDVDLTRTAFDDTGLEAVAGLPSLEGLRADSRQITDGGLQHVARAKGLAELSLGGAKITDLGMRALRGLESLRALGLSDTVLTAQAFAEFPQRPSLRKLDVSGTRFEGGSDLAKFPGLTNLAIAGCPVSDAGLTSLKDLKRLTKCDLSGTSAGDDTAKLLGALPDLEDANFARSKLTDAGVMALAAGVKIRQIDARGTKVTKEGAERAKMGRTRLEIRVD